MRTIPLYGSLTIVCLLSTSLLAQQRGSIGGTITDSTGAILPGASVVIKDERTGEERTVTSDEQGRYVVPGLKPSIYLVRGDLSGLGGLIGRLVGVEGNRFVSALSFGDPGYAAGESHVPSRRGTADRP